MSYPIHDQEHMAIVMSFQHWRRYLEGATETEVFSNQENLERFMSQTSLNGRQARWLLQPTPYDFRILLSKSTRESCKRIFASFSYHVDTESVDDTFVGKLLPFGYRTDKESVDDTLVGKLLPSLGSKMTNRLRPEPATPSSEASKSHVGREPEQLSSAVAWGVEPDQRLPEAVYLTDTEAVRVVQLLALS